MLSIQQVIALTNNGHKKAKDNSTIVLHYVKNRIKNQCQHYPTVAGCCRHYKIQYRTLNQDIAARDSPKGQSLKPSGCESIEKKCCTDVIQRCPQVCQKILYHSDFPHCLFFHPKY